MDMARSFRREQWKMLLATMFCYLFFYTGRHNFGWAAKDMAESLHFSYAEIGWISSAMLLGYALGQLINGNLADRFSPRNMITIGALMSVAVNFLISFSSYYAVILTLWALNGYFQSMAWAPGSRLISNWWRKEERGRAFGLYTMAAGSSSAVTYLLSILIIQQGAGWQSLFRLPVLFLLLAVVIFYLVARSRPSDRNYPELYNEVGGEMATNWRERYGAVFRNRKFMIAALALGFESMARYGMLVWVPVHYLGSDAKNIWASLLMPFGMALGAFSFGQISDRVFRGNRPSSIRMGMIVSSLIILSIYFVPAVNIFTVGALMFGAGFFVYGPQANFWPMSPDLLGERFVGTGVGVMNACAYIFAALGEPIFGKVIDETGDSSIVFIAISLVCLLSAVTVSFSSYKKSI